MKLFTSIPPRFTRVIDGRDVGAEYAQRCFQSWINCGLDPVSINAESEPSTHFPVKRIDIPRDARAEYGKPLVYLRDMLSVAYREDGKVAITNADIVTDHIPHFSRGECIIASRLDVEDVNGTDGPRYDHGFDFIAFHMEDVRPDGRDFVFGLPWWDHYLPVKLLLAGLRPKPARIYHLKHSERWDEGQWLSLAANYMDFIREEANAEYRSRLREPRRKGMRGAYDRLRTAARSLTPQGRALKTRNGYHRVAAVNENWIHASVEDQDAGAL